MLLVEYAVGILALIVGFGFKHTYLVNFYNGYDRF